MSRLGFMWVRGKWNLSVTL